MSRKSKIKTTAVIVAAVVCFGIFAFGIKTSYSWSTGEEGFPFVVGPRWSLDAYRGDAGTGMGVLSCLAGGGWSHITGWPLAATERSSPMCGEGGYTHIYPLGMFIYILVIGGVAALVVRLIMKRESEDE